ncbi:MAG: hypothetical protein Q9166_006745 [cf. Caloplaca sp. 2 TL-2023]
MEKPTRSDFDTLLTKARQQFPDLKSRRTLSATLEIDDGSEATNPQEFPSVIKRIVQAENNSNNVHEHILAAEAYLRGRQIDLSISENHVAATQLQDWTIQVISPTDVFAPEAPYTAESKSVASPEDIARNLSLRVTGLHLLSQLQNLPLSVSYESLSALIACITSFTNTKDPWTTEETSALAQSMLSNHLENLESSPKDLDTLITDLLSSHIKPLFLKSKTPLLTPQVRKAISPLPGLPAPSDFETGAKPWKFQSPHIVTVFQWTLHQLDADLIEKHWPLIIPPLLTILDDVSIHYKIKGCHFLTTLLKSTPSNLLERSGLGEVFHDTLIPYLLFLPSLTPEEESLPLLNATYSALLSLTLTRIPTPSSKRSKTLDAIFRYGILKGYAHAGENVRIAELLMKKCTDLVNVMEIHCVRHLKDILPMISGILTAPFATAYPPLLEASVRLLRAVIMNGWPRVRFHRGEILEGLVVCWCRIEDEEEPSGGILTVQGGIEEVLKAVVQLFRGDEELEKEFERLKGCDSRLQAVLRV